MQVVRAGLSLLAIGALVGAFLGACAPEEYFIDNTNPDPVPCERQIDCYRDGNLEVGTDCIQNQCLCHEPGEARLPCCKKGNDPYHCDRKCRPADECADPHDPIVIAGGNGTSGTGAGCESAPDCETADDCPEKPADSRCGTVLCINGSCQLTFRPIEKIDSQIRGDCVSTYCDGKGATIVLPDGEDDYNDGKECTFDTCENLSDQNIALPNGSPCPETGAGVCFDGKCVECIEDDNCGAGFVCDALLCVPFMCWQNQNGMVDPPLETGVDCGGQCYPCFYPQSCTMGSDCADGVCFGTMCALPTHSDGIKNDNETGVDCGCMNCPLCPDTFDCETWENCQSLVCWAGKCQAPTCNDGRKNGSETGVDCGATCNNTCF